MDERCVIAHNLKQIRAVKGMTQAAVAERAGISLPTYTNVERGKTTPLVSTLQKIASALEVKTRELVLQVRPLKAVRFRAAKRMKSPAFILADVGRWLDDFNQLEEMLSLHDPYLFKDLQRSLRKRIKERRAIEAASKAREIAGLGEKEVIRDICGLLESTGVKVYPISLDSKDFFGLSVAEDDGGPAIVVNVHKDISVERQIFSAAHELGHLILHLDTYDVEDKEEDSDQEKDANYFSSHFLMPNNIFRNEWNDARGLGLVNCVLKVKRIFKVSYKTILYRLIELGVVDKSIWMMFNVAFNRAYNKSLRNHYEPFGLDEHAPEAMRSCEPGDLEPMDFVEDRLSRLVREAFEADMISMSRAAEILRINHSEMRELVSSWSVFA
jgi:Zn-dependent peptidase ImmA (M78 family)/DNA-binding XRE family transcriptional regulator